MNISVFSPTWLALLALSIGGMTALGLTLKAKSEKQRRTVMFVLTTIGFVLWILYKIWLSQDKEFDFIIWNELPLHICNTVSMFAIVASIINDRVWQGYCFHIGTIGAVMSVLMPPSDFTGVPLWSARGLGYYGYHFMLLAICIGFVTAGLYRPKYKDALKHAVLFFGLGAIIHCINLLLRATVYPEANYFYSFGMEGNPILEGLLKIIPIPLLYALPLVVLIGVLGLGMFWIVRRFTKE